MFFYFRLGYIYNLVAPLGLGIGEKRAFLFSIYSKNKEGLVLDRYFMRKHRGRGNCLKCVQNFFIRKNVSYKENYFNFNPYSGKNKSKHNLNKDMVRNYQDNIFLCMKYNSLKEANKIKKAQLTLPVVNCDFFPFSNVLKSCYAPWKYIFNIIKVELHHVI